GVLPMLTTGPNGDHFLVVPAEERKDTVLVRQLTLDHLATYLPSSPTHLKIDVEGFEKEVLEAGRSFLKSYRPTLFLELHGALLRMRGCSPEKVFELLAECGYRNWERHRQPISEAEAAALDVCRLIGTPTAG